MSVKAPPMIGATTDDTAKIIPVIEVSMGRLRRGTSETMIIMAPVKMPAEPIPAIARPTINAVEVGAAPQITEPTSNTIMQEIKVHFVE